MTNDVTSEAILLCRQGQAATLSAAPWAGAIVRPYQGNAEGFLLLLAPRLTDLSLQRLLQAMQRPATDLVVAHAQQRAGHQALVLAVPEALSPPQCRTLATLCEIDIGWSRLAEPWRWPRAAVFDMDSTLITMEVIDELAGAAGEEAGAKVAAITESAMRGELDFNQSLRQRVAALRGLPAASIAAVKQGIEFNPGVPEFALAAREQRCKLALISGGFVPFAEQVQARLQFDFARANTLGWDAPVAGANAVGEALIAAPQATLSGEVLGEIVNAEVKARSLRELAQEWSCSTQEMMAVGDGANDALMLQAAGLGVAFRAKPKLREQADLALEVSDMRALLALFVDA